MPRKSFKDDPALAFISVPLSAHLQEVQEEVQAKEEAASGLRPPASGPAGQPKPGKAGKGTYWRACLNLRAEYKEYINEEAWKQRITATDYINRLIAADMAAKGV